MFDIPDHKNISEVVIDEDVVNGKKKPIVIYSELPADTTEKKQKSSSNKDNSKAS